MAMPSSPPLLAQVAPASPPLSPMQLETRKRQFPDYDSLSSDPIFSEDASESDGYTGPKRKRLFKGPWWLDSASAARRVAKSGKIVDSGVWLASENSDHASQPDFFMDDASDAPGSSPPCYEHESLDLPREEPPKLCLATALAARIVESCVEKGQETVDMSGICLPTFSSDDAKALGHLMRVHNMDRTAENSYVRLTPDLRLFVGNNELKDLPLELWDLENMTVLSLRNNSLKGISERIGNLHRLQELNIASNQIETLPFEILELLQPRAGSALLFTTHPNPFLLPVKSVVLDTQPSLSLRSIPQVQREIARLRFLLSQPSTSSLHTLYTMILRTANEWLRHKLRDPRAQTGPIFAASTEVTYYDTDGAPLRSQHELVHAGSGNGFGAIAGSPSLPSEWCSKAPSLFEIAVRSCTTSSWLREVTAELLYVPPRVEQGIRMALDSKARSLHVCSVCQRRCIIKRAEWIEYWYCNKDDPSIPTRLAFLPFTRKACSFGCVKSLSEEREKRDEQDVVDSTMMDV